MKKKYSSILAVLLSLLLAVSFIACDDSSSDDDNTDSPDGSGGAANATMTSIQASLFDDDYSAWYLTAKEDVAQDEWVSYSTAVKEANVDYDGELDTSATTKLRVQANFEEAGGTAVFYLKNIKLTNGSAAPVDVTVAEGDDYSDTYVARGENTTIVTEEVGEAWAIKITGSPVDEYDTKSIEIQFDLSAATDISSGDYTASFDVYVPGETEEDVSGDDDDDDGDDDDGPTEDADPTDNYDISYFQGVIYDDDYNQNQYPSGIGDPHDSWKTYSEDITAANVDYDGGLDETVATNVRVKAVTANADEKHVYYLKNIVLSNGSDKPLNIQIDESSDYSGTYFAQGDNGTISTVYKGGAWCLKVIAESVDNNGYIGSSIQFDLESATDISGDDYTLSFDVYEPAASL